MKILRLYCIVIESDSQLVILTFCSYSSSSTFGIPVDDIKEVVNDLLHANFSCMYCVTHTIVRVSRSMLECVKWYANPHTFILNLLYDQA